jgi:hypothetical protein
MWHMLAEGAAVNKARLVDKQKGEHCSNLSTTNATFGEAEVKENESK